MPLGPALPALTTGASLGAVTARAPAVGDAAIVAKWVAPAVSATPAVAVGLGVSVVQGQLLPAAIEPPSLESRLNEKKRGGREWS